MNLRVQPILMLNMNMSLKEYPHSLQSFLKTIVNNGKIIFDFSWTQSLGSYHDHELFYLCQATN